MIRRAFFVEKLAPEWDAVRQVAATDPPASLIQRAGAELTAFMAERTRARDRKAALSAEIYPPDPELDADD